MDTNPGRGSHRLLSVRPSGPARVAVSGFAIGAVAVTMAFIDSTPSLASTPDSTAATRRRQPTPTRLAPLVPVTLGETGTPAAPDADQGVVAPPVYPAVDTGPAGSDDRTEAPTVDTDDDGIGGAVDRAGGASDGVGGAGDAADGGYDTMTQAT